MARYNIKLDYGIIEKLAQNCQKLSMSFEEIKISVKNMENIVSECNGDAARAAHGKGDEIVKNLDKLGSGLGLFGEKLLMFSNDMSAIINSSQGSMLHINTVDVRWNLRQMVTDIIEFNVYARSASPKLQSNDFNMVNTDILNDESKLKISQIEGKLDNIKEMLITAASDICKYEDDFEKISKLISEFENKDDEYRDILQEAYYEISDASFWSKTSTKIIIGVTLIGIAAVIVFVAPALAAIGGVVGTCAAAIAGCSALVTVATEVLAVGLFTATFAGGLAVFSGEDIEDAIGGGLFDGTVTSVITGGFGVFAKSAKYVSYGAKTLSKTPLKNSAIAKETVEFVMSEGMDYAGTVLASTALKFYKGQEINMAKIGTDAAFDRGLGVVFKGASNLVDDKINVSDVHLIRDGKLSLNDLKNAFVNGVNNKSVEAAKEVTSQLGHEAIDNYYENVEEPLKAEQEDVDIEVDTSKVSENVVKKDLKGRVVEGLKNYVENEVEDATGVDMDN